MKGKSLLALLLIPMVLIGFFSCDKENKTLNTGNGMTLKSLFEGLKSTPQGFTVNAGTSQTITGTKGTVITFHPQSFKDASGNIISSGSIAIELTEMYKPGEMIANHVTTTTASQVQLTSGGSVYIKATLNGQEVFANSYSIGFKQPAYADAPMALFRGYAVTDSTGDNIKWYDDTTGTITRTTKIDSSQGSSYYYLFDSCTSFNWMNCDYFYTAPAPKTDVRVVLPDNSFDATNTQVFVVFPGINSVSMMYAYDATTHSFSFGYPGYYLPLGTNVHIMVISAKNNTYYSGLQENINVTNGISVTITPAAQSLSNIQAQLAGL